MARYDDGKRGFGVTDALGLSEAWLQVRAMLDAGALQFPDRDAPRAMVDFFRATYPAEQWESAMRSQMQAEDAERMMIGAVKCGQLPLWIAPVEGPSAERQVASNGLIEFGRQSLIAGCYRPYNDTENLVYGYPLFVKSRDWTQFIAALGPAQQRMTEAAKQPSSKSRKKPGPPPDPDWPAAIAKVTEDCIAAGYKKPLARGCKAAIQTMLLNFMAEKDKHFSDDIAAKHVTQVIAGLPDK